jgi:hypothetical protein
MSSEIPQIAKLIEFLRRRKEIEEKYVKDLNDLIKEEHNDSLHLLMEMTESVARDHHGHGRLYGELADKIDLVDKKYRQTCVESSLFDNSSQESKRLFDKMEKSRHNLAEFDRLRTEKASYNLKNLRKSLRARYRDDVVSFEEFRINCANKCKERDNAANTYEQASFTTKIFCLKSIGKQLEESCRNLYSCTLEFEKAIQGISSPSRTKDFVQFNPIEPGFLVENGLVLKGILQIHHKIY